jgi:PPOX class probable F420-dependent enzyme
MASAAPEVIDFLKSHRLGVLATGRRDGSPQQALIAYHFDGTDFAISTRSPSAKAKNIRRRQRVSLAVSDGPRVVVVYGRARLVSEAGEVLRYNLTRLRSPRQTEPVDETALARRLAAEERVVVVVTPEKYLPSSFEARGR